MQMRSNGSIENERNSVNQASEDDAVDSFTPCQPECDDGRWRLPSLRIDRVRDPEPQYRERCPRATLNWCDIGVDVAPLVWVGECCRLFRDYPSSRLRFLPQLALHGQESLPYVGSHLKIGREHSSVRKLV